MYNDSTAYDLFPEDDQFDGYEAEDAPLATVHTLPVPAPKPAPVQQPTPVTNLFGEVPDPTRVVEAATHPMTDMGLGARLAIHFRGHLAWAMSEGKGHWLTYNGKHWEHDYDGTRAADHMRTVIASIGTLEADFAADNDPAVKAAEKSHKVLSITNPDDLETLANSSKRIKQLRTAARMNRIEFGDRVANGMSHINAATEAAKFLLRMDYDLFDAKPTWINCPNGTVDVKTLEVREHNALDYLTKITAVDYVPGATHGDVDTVLANLDRNDPGLAKQTMRILGMATTDLNAKSFWYVTGVANSGKSTLFIPAVQALGAVGHTGYGLVLSPSVLMTSRNDDGERATGNLHSLMNVRLAFLDEAEKGFPNAAVIKTLSAGGGMRTRKTYGDNMSWTSKVKLVFAGNGRMAMPDNDTGMQERLIASYLPQQAANRDEGLQYRLLEREQQQALLSMMIQAGHEWIAEGVGKAALALTEGTRTETAKYMELSDPLKDFFEECVTEVEEGEAYLPLTTSQWMTLYNAFCRRTGVAAALKSQKHFAERLDTRGHTVSANTTRTHEGIRVRGRVRKGIASVMTPEALANMYPSMGLERVNAPAY